MTSLRPWSSSYEPCKTLQNHQLQQTMKLLWRSTAMTSQKSINDMQWSLICHRHILCVLRLNNGGCVDWQAVGIRFFTFTPKKLSFLVKCSLAPFETHCSVFFFLVLFFFSSKIIINVLTFLSLQTWNQVSLVSWLEKLHVQGAIDFSKSYVTFDSHLIAALT